jgi:hypothetical protein
MELTSANFSAGADDRVATSRIEQTKRVIGHGRGLFDHRERADEIYVCGNRASADGEVLDSAQRVNSPIGIGRYVALAKQVMFTSRRHVDYVLLLRSVPTNGQQMRGPILMAHQTMRQMYDS